MTEYQFTLKFSLDSVAANLTNSLSAWAKQGAQTPWSGSGNLVESGSISREKQGPLRKLCKVRSLMSSAPSRMRNWSRPLRISLD